MRGRTGLTTRWLAWGAAPILGLMAGMWALAGPAPLDHGPKPLMAVEDNEKGAPQAAEAQRSSLVPGPKTEVEADRPPVARRPVALSVSAPTAEAPPAKTFDGRPLERVRTLEMEVTAYSPDERSCGVWANGITASGYSVWTNGMRLVAADTRLLPMGTIVTVPGYDQGRPVEVLDRGGKIKGRRLDVLFPTHEEAEAWGRRTLEVQVWRYADE